MENNIQLDNNRKNKMNLFEISLYITIFAEFLIFFGHPYKNNILVSSGTRLLIITNILCTLIYFINILRNNRLKYVDIIVLFIIFTSFIALVLNNNNSIYSSLIVLVRYWALPFYLTYYKNISNKTRVKVFIYKSYIVLSLFYIYLSFTQLRNIGYTKWGIYQGYLTLGYSNPNETGMYLLICFIVLLSATMFYKNKIIVTFLFLDSMYLLYLIYQTNSRTSFFIALFILILSFTGKKINKKYIYISILIPIGFVIVNLIYTEFLSEIVLLGNSAGSGRDIIYKNYLLNLNFTSFLIGDFSLYKFSNLHNAYISILATIGLIGILPYFSLLQSTFLQIKEKGIDQRSKQIAFIGLLGIIIHSSAEAALLVAGGVFGSSVGILYLLTLSDD